MTTRVLTLVFLLIAAAAEGQTIHGFLWTSANGIQDLGASLEWPDSYAYAISQSGLIVGFLAKPNGRETAAAWTAGTGWRALKGGLSSEFSAALGVNNAGQVVGLSGTETAYHAFLWTQSGGMVDLGTLGGTTSVAYAINQSGEVVGYSATGQTQGQYHAFLWTQSTGMQDLGSLSDLSSYAFAINDYGVIVGTSTEKVKTGFETIPVLWKDNQIQPLNGLTDGGGQPVGINNSGQVIVNLSEVNQNETAVSWTRAGGAQEIELLPGATMASALGINSSGQVVGYQLISPLYYPFLWTSQGGTQELGGPSTWPTAINDSGEVVGYAQVADK